MKRLVPMIVFLVAACGSGEPETATTTSPERTTTTTEATTTTTEATTTTTEAPTTTTTTEPEPSAEECLVGAWELDSEAFAEGLMEAMGPDAEEAGITDVSVRGGDYVLELDADGTFRNVREDWQLLFETSQGNLVTTFDGFDAGTYEVEGDTIESNVTEGETDVGFGLEVDGEVQEMPFGSAQSFDVEPFEGLGSFECEGDTLTVSTIAEGPDGEELTFRSVFNRR